MNSTRILSEMSHTLLRNLKHYRVTSVGLHPAVLGSRNFHIAKKTELFLSSQDSSKILKKLYAPCLSVPRAHLSFGRKDKDPPKYDPVKGDLVYVGTVANLVKVVKMFSLTTSVLGMCFQPILYSRAMESELPVILKIFMSGFVNFFIFITPALLHFITKRYVTSLYFNRDTGMYTATTLNFLVNDVNTTFSRDKVVVPETVGLLATFNVNSKPFFVDPAMFLDKNAYIHLMSYDKPIDWNFEDEVMEDEHQEKTKSQK